MSEHARVDVTNLTPTATALAAGAAFTLALSAVGAAGGGLRAVLAESDAPLGAGLAGGVALAALGATAALAALRFRLATPAAVAAAFAVLWTLAAGDPEALSVFTLLVPGVIAGTVAAGAVEYALRSALVGAEGALAVPAVDPGPVAVAAAAGGLHVVAVVVAVAAAGGPDAAGPTAWGLGHWAISVAALFALAAVPAWLALGQGIVLPALVAVPTTLALTTTTSAPGGLAARYDAVASLALPVVLAVAVTEWLARNALG